MRDALAILDEAEAGLAPLSLASNLAWWESQVAATEENAERRTRAELELSDARVQRQQAGANRAVAARDLQVARARVALLPDLPIGNALPTTGGNPIILPAPTTPSAPVQQPSQGDGQFRNASVQFPQSQAGTR